MTVYERRAGGDFCASEHRFFGTYCSKPKSPYIDTARCVGNVLNPLEEARYNGSGREKRKGATRRGSSARAVVIFQFSLPGCLGIEPGLGCVVRKGRECD